jgi:hypothetical protein
MGPHTADARPLGLPRNTAVLSARADTVSCTPSHRRRSSVDRVKLTSSTSPGAVGKTVTTSTFPLGHLTTCPPLPSRSISMPALLRAVQESSGYDLLLLDTEGRIDWPPLKA